MSDNFLKDFGRRLSRSGNPFNLSPALLIFGPRRASSSIQIVCSFSNPTRDPMGGNVLIQGPRYDILITINNELL